MGSWPVFLEHSQKLKQQCTYLTVLRRIDTRRREIVVVRKLHSLSEEPIVDGRLVAHKKHPAITLVLFLFILDQIPRISLVFTDLKMTCEWTDVQTYKPNANLGTVRNSRSDNH